MKKVLIITYYWPPSGGGGVQRWLKFAKYLTDFGWIPIVLTPSNASVKEKDYTLDQDVHSLIKVVKIPIWEPYGVASKVLGFNTVPKQGIVRKDKSLATSLLTWLRANLLIPDTRIFWKKQAVNAALKILKEEDIDILVTTGPPHSMHLIGLDIKRKINIKWVSDFRDPWAEWDILDDLKPSKLARKMHHKLEKKVIQNSDKVITVSQTWANDFSKKHKKRIEVITNGFDIEENTKRNDRVPNRFRLSHFGLINQFRNPPVLWNALEELCTSSSDFYNNFELFLGGNIDENTQYDIEQYEYLKSKTTFAGYLPHSTLSDHYAKTVVFLLLSNKTKNSKGHIPGKVFEYISQRRPILAFTSSEGDAAQIIRSTDSGYILDQNNKQEIKEAILKIYKDYKLKRYDLKEENISQYTRKNITKNLTKLFNEIVNN